MQLRKRQQGPLHSGAADMGTPPGVSEAPKGALGSNTEQSLRATGLTYATLSLEHSTYLLGPLLAFQGALRECGWLTLLVSTVSFTGIV